MPVSLISSDSAYFLTGGSNKRSDNLSVGKDKIHRRQLDIQNVRLAWTEGVSKER